MTKKLRIEEITYTLFNRVAEKGHLGADALYYALNAGVKFSLSKTSDQGDAPDDGLCNHTNITKIQEQMVSYFDHLVQDRRTGRLIDRLIDEFI